jgi:cyclopropane fatty-acyl-phospholipid synthase-like methyltransferase
MVSKILYFCIFIIIICIIYNIIIKKYFRKKNDDSISYNLLKGMINVVSEDNNFMNYGLWNDDTKSLIEANKNLVNFIFNKSELENKENMKILDIGCGYGEQDIEWCNKLDKSCTIKAFDISEEQIIHATSRSSNPNINFEVCDVKNISTKYKNELFDVIFSLESAFHYQDRETFFKDANNLLNHNGKFIITDLMLKNNYNENNLMNKLFIYFFSDFLYIPSKNLISSEEWTNQLNANFTIEENLDITENTFKPYYNHFISTYIKRKNLPECVGNMFTSFFIDNQPFSYKIVVCKKKLDKNADNAL